MSAATMDPQTGEDVRPVLWPDGRVTCPLADAGTVHDAHKLVAWTDWQSADVYDCHGLHESAAIVEWWQGPRCHVERASNATDLAAILDHARRDGGVICKVIHVPRVG